MWFIIPVAGLVSALAVTSGEAGFTLTVLGFLGTVVSFAVNSYFRTQEVKIQEYQLLLSAASFIVLLIGLLIMVIHIIF